MRHRFFADNKDIADDEIVLTGENAAHAAVLRLGIGEEIVVCNGAGMDYRCVVFSCNKSETKAKVLHKAPNTAEPFIAVTLFQALPKIGKMDEIVEKCTQLGISRVVPIITSRCVTKASDRDTKKTARWQKIAQSAASQSRRGQIPQICDIMTLEAALREADAHNTAFVCYEGEERFPLKAFLHNLPQSPSSIAFFVGPEGGFALDEMVKFKDAGIAAVSLGPRILRTELAGAVVLANIMYELEKTT